MAKKKNNTNDTKTADSQEEIFDDSVGIEEDVDVDFDEEDQQSIESIDELISNPEKVLKNTEDTEENEEIMYCPNCGVTGLFVDNICMNCGQKKAKKTSRSNNDDEDELSFSDDESLSIEEF